MENLLIKHKTHVVLRRFLGILALVCGIVYIFLSIETPKALNIILSIFWILFGTAYLIPAWLPSESSVMVGMDKIEIRWLNWLRSKKISDTEVDKVIVTWYEIRIDRKNGKRIILPTEFFETDQKKKVCEYFIELSKQKSYPLERIGFGKE